MQLTPNEIDTIEEAGMMNGSPVKLLRTKGGFWIATGKPRGKQREEALAAGSHPAIVKYNLEKQFAHEFQPAMMKSEVSLNPAVVTKHTQYLSDDMQKSGHDIYAVQTGSHIEFQLTKHDVKIGHINANLEKDALVVNEMNITKEFSSALAGAATEKAIACGASKVRIQDK